MSPARTSPPAGLHRITTSSARARTERAPWVFLRSTKPHDDMNDLDDKPEKKATQEEQDVEDERARKQAMKNLVSSWQERLQLISVITTFFATTEAGMLVNTKPTGSDDLENNILQVSNAALLGALILHVYASVLSFLGAFLLISYKLREATREEMIVEGIQVVESPLARSVIKDVERDLVDHGLQHSLTSTDARSMTHNSIHNSTGTSAPEQNNTNGLYPAEPPVFSANPHVEQVVPFMSHASTHQLLCRTHAICVFLAALGFVLALVGIICYSWALQPNAVSIFASVCLGGALLTMFALRI